MDGDKRGDPQVLSNTLPVFVSHYSYQGSSLLTLEEAGKSEAGGPVSICDIAKENGLKQVILCDDRIDGFLEAYKNIGKVGAQLIYGVKLTICSDIKDKSDSSLDTESNIIIFIKNTNGYGDLIKIYNRAWTDGFYYKGRADWELLKTFWTDNLLLALPYFSSFIAKNTLTMSTIVPALPDKPWIFKEVDCGLPFAGVLDEAVDEFARENEIEPQPIKTIYYKGGADFKSYVVLKCIANRSSFDKPQENNLASDRFCWSEYTRLSCI